MSAPVRKLDKPSEELKGFAKADLLQPGKSQNITFTLNARDLASYDPAVSSWIAEAGKYTVKIAASSANIKQTGSFSLAKDIMVEKTHKVLLPQTAITDMKNNKAQ